MATVVCRRCGAATASSCRCEAAAATTQDELAPSTAASLVAAPAAWSGAQYGEDWLGELDPQLGGWSLSPSWDDSSSNNSSGDIDAGLKQDDHRAWSDYTFVEPGLGSDISDELDNMGNTSDEELGFGGHCSWTDTSLESDSVNFSQSTDANIAGGEDWVGDTAAFVPTASVDLTVQAPIWAPGPVPVPSADYSIVAAQRQKLIEKAHQTILKQDGDTAVQKSGKAYDELWQCVEMLLNDDVHDYAPRPDYLGGVSTSAIFREEGRMRRNRQSDRWTQSGGNKGSTQWPVNHGTPRIRRKYGKVIVSGESPDECRYHVYSLIGSIHGAQERSERQSRRLYVVLGKTLARGSQQVRSEAGERVEDALGAELRQEATEWVEDTSDAEDERSVAEIESLLASLESQANETAPETYIEAIHRLLRCVAELPQTASHRVQKYERPYVVDRECFRRFYLELEPHKRRKRARAASIVQKLAGARAQSSSPFDKWMNSGGKRGLVRLHTASGEVIVRRAGRIESPYVALASQGPPPTTNLKYYQYCIEGKSTKAETSSHSSEKVGSATITVFYLYETEGKIKKKGKPTAEQASEKRNRKSPGNLTSDAGRPLKRPKLARGMACASSVLMFVAACTALIRQQPVARPTANGDESSLPRQQNQCATTNNWDAETISCKQKLDDFCNSPANIDCWQSMAKAYGSEALPMVGLYDSNALGELSFRCYSALAVKDGRWDGVHPGYCSGNRDALTGIFNTCTGRLPVSKTLQPPCQDVLTAGGSCTADLAFGATWAGACNLACGFNELDTIPSGAGVGSCEATIASGNATCELDFAPNGRLAGMCDFACGYCSQSDMIASRSSPSPPCTSADCTCLTGDMFDGSVLSDHSDANHHRILADNCIAALPPHGQMSCDVDFAYGGDQQGKCDHTCGFNAYDSEYGVGTCAKVVATGQMSCKSHFGPTGPYAGYCDFTCGYCAPPPLPPVIPTSHSPCVTLNQYDKMTGYNGLCDAFVNFPDEFNCSVDFSKGGRFARLCDMACGLNSYDSSQGVGSCHELTTTASLTCAVDFDEHGQYPGYCDFECGYCNPPTPAPISPRCNQHARECLANHDCSQILGRQIDNIEVCLSNKLCNDFISCYKQEAVANAASLTQEEHKTVS